MSRIVHPWPARDEVMSITGYSYACCSILTYGSEAWILDKKASKLINGANAYMLSHITGRSKHEEASADTTFAIIPWIRAHRLKWVGHILRLPDSRLISKTLRHIYDNPQHGDILMDIPQATGWKQLQKIAEDRDAWRTDV